MIQFKKHLESITPYVVKSRFTQTMVKLIANENPLGCSEKAFKAIKEYSNLADYPCIQCSDLKEKLSEKLCVPTDHLIIGNGSDEIFTFIAGAIISPGDEMITAETTFSQYAFATKFFGGTSIFTKLVDGTFSVDNILNAITSNTKWIAIANPNNPTGTYLKKEELKRLMDNVPEHILVMIDEAYIEYSTAPDIAHAIELIDSYRNLIVTRTFSKIYGLASLRVGYGIAQPYITEFLNKLRSPYNINTLGQIAATVALDDEVFIKNSIKYNLIGKRFLSSELEDIGLKHYPTEGNFLFISLPVDGTAIANSLAKEGVLVRAAGNFGIKNAMRVTIGKPEQNEIFISKLEKIIKNLYSENAQLTQA